MAFKLKNKELKKIAGQLRNSATMHAKQADKLEKMSPAKNRDKKGKGSGQKDACYYKVKSRYRVWPSAYASGALVKCRNRGASNWGNS